MLALAVATLLHVAPAFAADRMEPCLRTRIWDGYADGWAVRSANTATLASGAYKVYALTLYAGNAYRILGCGEKNLAHLDLVVYDAAGAQVAASADGGNDPRVEFRPASSGTYYLAMHATRFEDPSEPTRLAAAVTYR